ncbi:retrovirus-related pol polyprotein from transposon TNT 1-94 [Tanacetum coccineum]
MNDRSCETYNAKDVTALIEQNECVRVELEKELLEYLIGTLPKKSQRKRNNNASKAPSTPELRKARVNTSTEASGSKPRSNTKKNRILPAKSENKKKVEDHPRTKKVSMDKRLQQKLGNGNRNSKLSTLDCFQMQVVQVILWYLDSGCSKHMTGNRSKLKNFVEKFIGIVRFGNDHFGAIVGYGDYVIGDSVISRVYYVEGLRHNLFSVGKFCDSDLEIAFRKHSCFVCDMNGVDLLKGSRSTNLYTILINDMLKSSPVCLLSKASKTKSWLWHRLLNHLNFGTINDLARKDLVRDLPRLKFEKDHLCLACQLGKSKKYSHKPKSENTNKEVLHTLHMDLCGPIRVQSINGKKYILVIVDDYSRFTWVKFLRSKEMKTPEFVIIILKQLLHDLTFSPEYLVLLCVSYNDSKDLGKFQAKVTLGILLGPEPIIMTHGQLKSGLASTDYKECGSCGLIRFKKKYVGKVLSFLRDRLFVVIKRSKKKHGISTHRMNTLPVLDVDAQILWMRSLSKTTDFFNKNPMYCDKKNALFKHMHKNRTANRNPANFHLYHALMEALIADEDAMDKEASVDTKPGGKSTKRRRQVQGTSGSEPESGHSEHSSDDVSKQDEGHVSDLEDTDNAHIPKVTAATWFKPIPEDERPATPEPEWTIPPNDFPEPGTNWGKCIRQQRDQVPAENKLQRKDVNVRFPYQIGSADEHERRKLSKLCWTNKVDLVNPEGHQILRNIYEPLPLGGPPGQVTIQPQFFFNKDLEYLLTGDKERKTALSISKLKAARYLDFGLEELVPSLWVKSERDYDISAAYGNTHWWFRRKQFYINKHSEPSDYEAVRSQMRILSVIRVKTFKKYGYSYLREIILRRNHLKMEMEMEFPVTELSSQSPNAKTRPTLVISYERSH